MVHDTDRQESSGTHCADSVVPPLSTPTGSWDSDSSAIDEAYCVEVLDHPVRAATDPVRGSHLDQLTEDDLLGTLFGSLQSTAEFGGS